MKNPAPDALTDQLDRFFRRTVQGIRPGLDIIRALLASLDDPQNAVPYIHVAGTNGKGSVCALLSALLNAAGYRTGCYTSPHLQRFNERIQVGGTPIDDAFLSELIDRIEEHADGLETEQDLRTATFFECATAMAFTHFRDAAVDWAVIETGMGGRWDATNVGVPAVSVITRIDIDHANYLGRDPVGIAREKAGIIKPGVPVVRGPLPEPIAEVIEEVAREVGAPVWRADEVVSIQRMKQGWDGQRIRIEIDGRDLRPVQLPLIGRHQLENAALALTAIEALQASGHVTVPDQAIAKGISACRWPGRCQLLSNDPVILLDVAHNPDGARALGQTIHELCGKQPVGLVVGFLGDKDIAGCVNELAAVAKRFWVVPIQHPRAAPVDEVARAVAAARRPVETGPLQEMMDRARSWAVEEGGVVCVAGSVYLAGEVLDEWGGSTSMRRVD